MGVSFADYIGAMNDCNIIKEAVSGTTLVDEGVDSYISRLNKIDTQNADIFVCQLSTNDATQKNHWAKSTIQKTSMILIQKPLQERLNI